MSTLAFVVILATAVIGAVVLLGLTVFLVHLSAELKWQFIRVPENELVTVVKGNDFLRFIPNIEGYKISEEPGPDGHFWVVPGEHPASLLEEEFGISYVSLFYPLRRVLEIHISKNRLKDMLKSDTLKDRIEVAEGEVTSFRFIVQRPLWVNDVELPGDNSQINVIVLATFELVIPAIPIFVYKGDFMKYVDEDLSAALVDFLSTYRTDESGQFDPKGTEKLTLAHFMQMPKGEGSPLHNHFLLLNANREFWDRVTKCGDDIQNRLSSIVKKRPGRIPGSAARDIPGGLIPKYGLALIDIELSDYEPNERTKKLSEALQEKETQEREALGVIARAEGEAAATIARAKGNAEATRLQANAEAARWKSLIGAQKEEGVDPNQASHVLQTRLEMEQLHGSGVNTYVRGPTPGIVIPTNPNPPTTKPDKPDPSDPKET